MKNKSGFADVLIGLQYGDEGKAKVIDLLAPHYDIIARFNGGANAGHTIKTDKGSIGLHQIPSGIFYKEKILYIGSGCVVNVEKLAKEVIQVKKLGINLVNRLFISSQASLIQPHHILVDIVTSGGIGTTKNGIGPAYADRAMRMMNTRLVNIKIGDVLSDTSLIQQIRSNLEHKIKKYNVTDINVDMSMNDFKQALDFVAPFVTGDTLFLEKLVKKGKSVLFEGAQSVMLDVVKGITPYVTSSNTVAGAAYVGGDLPPTYHRKTIGVVKAIMSRVGNGPFVSEFGADKSEEYSANSTHTKDFETREYNVDKLWKSQDMFDVGIALRIQGDEYGTTTKRPRRIGMLDLVQLAYTVAMNGVDELFINKCDLLKDFAKTNLGKIPVVVGYKLDGKTIDYVPSSNKAYRSVTPVVENYGAFADDIRSINTKAKLPKPLQTLLQDIEKRSGCKILGIGTGAKREEYILF